MYRLIIADDEPQITKGLSTTFPWDKMGFEIKGTFSNGLEVINYISSCPDTIDLILCDIKMPIMTGLDVAEYTYKNYPNIKIIF